MKIVRLGNEAKISIKTGVDAVANAVKLTLGPAGRNAIIGRPYQNPLLTNDGITVAREIELQDEIEQLGKEAVDDALKSANGQAGDGTTTTTVLLQAINNSAFKRLESKNKFEKVSESPMNVRKVIIEDTKKAIQLLKKQVKQIKSLKDLERVAIISVENEYLGKNIAKIFHELGKESLIQTVDSPFEEVTFDSIKGLDISAGLPTVHFENINNKYLTDNPTILVTNHYLSSPDQVKSFTTEKPLIIIADNFTKEFIAECINTTDTNTPVIPLKVPVFNESETLKDYACILGATFIDKDKDNIATKGLECLGTSEKVIISKDKTVFVGVHGDITNRKKTLEEQLETVESEYDKELLKKRISKLSGGIGVIKVGSNSPSEKDYLKLKIEDAVNATRSALEEGIVKGGGLALKEVAEQMKDSILYEALIAPYNQIQLNAGGNLEIGEEVIDPFKVTRTALEKASSVASIIITTEIAIADKREPKKDKTLEE
jgi:chaperonin GroEL